MASSPLVQEYGSAGSSAAPLSNMMVYAALVAFLAAFWLSIALLIV